MQRNKQVAMGRKKFNMDPKKVIKVSVKALNKSIYCYLLLEFLNCMNMFVCVFAGDSVPD